MIPTFYEIMDERQEGVLGWIRRHRAPREAIAVTNPPPVPVAARTEAHAG